jgi:hypothetical protein
MELVLERQAQEDETTVMKKDGSAVLLAPMIHSDYWLYRVRLSDEQAIVGFPKFGMIGIGFAVEEDWNTNLPALTPAEQILAHIGRNKGDDGIDDADVLAAIRLVQAAVREDAEKVEA